MRWEFLASWIGTVALVFISPVASSELGAWLAILGAFALALTPPILVATQSRRGRTGDPWFTQHGQWGWVAGCAVTLAGSLPARLAFQLGARMGHFDVGELIIAIVMAIALQLTFVSVLHGIMFAWLLPANGRGAVVRFRVGLLRRTVRATGLSLAAFGLLTFDFLAIVFISARWWGTDIAQYGPAFAATPLLVGAGLYWIGAAPPTKRLQAARQSVPVVVEDEA